MKINSLKKIKNLTGKTVFCRVDFNVPLEKGRIKNDYKIIAGLETILFLSSLGARVIVATHLGDPKGKKKAKLSTAPLARRLQKLSRLTVKFVPAVSGAPVAAALLKLKPKQILFLENLRFEGGELNDDTVFARKLASLADIYVNDAFAVSHRAQASVSAIKKYLPAYAGLLLEKEVNALQAVLKPKKPLVTIMGGAKISTKAPIIKSLYPVSSQILIGGGLANNFFKFYGLEIGRSLFDKDSLKTIKSLLRGKEMDKKIILPLDVIVKTKTGKILARKISEVKKQEYIFDIGPETVRLYASYIKKAKTLVWNGPLGKFEEEPFKNGTLAIARLVAARSTGPSYGVVGGGETVAALKQSQMMEYVDWVSTAGGAMLAYLGQEKMPGLKKIVY